MTAGETKPEKNILTVTEVAELLSMSVSALYQWVSAKKIPHIKVGHFTRFDRREIDKWLQKNKVEARS